MELGHGILSAPSAAEPSVGSATCWPFMQCPSLVFSALFPPEPPQSLVELPHVALDEIGQRGGREKGA